MARAIPPIRGEAWHENWSPYKVNEKVAWSEERRALVLDEMNRLLADPTFKSSKRCQSMLVPLINYALAGDFNGLKERTLGVEAFGRDPNYDTNNDPIVRTTATEIRKRLAQAGFRVKAAHRDMAKAV